MNILEKFITRTKRYGFQYVMKVIVKNKVYYPIDNFVMNTFRKIYSDLPLKDIIVIESHNDFDCNGGAFYDYLIENGYNEKYRIVWLLKHPEFRPNVLPENVDWVPQYKPSLKKSRLFCEAKYFLYDMTPMPKVQKGQISVYCTHGAVSLKKPSGYMILPDDLDYCFAPSEDYEKIYEKIFTNANGLPYPNDKYIRVGYPVHDVLYSEKKGDLTKIVGDNRFSKVLLWMPTFRKALSFERNDSTTEQALGIPLIENLDEYKQLNQYLKDNNALLIIKIHPMQDLSNLLVYNTSNIRVLTGADVKALAIDNYKLMKDVSALISDYSSVAYDFLHCNKPIAYDLSDVKDYKLGLVVSDPTTMMAGHIVNNLSDFYRFIDDVVTENDLYAAKRAELCKRLFAYQDGDSCMRVAEFLKL